MALFYCLQFAAPPCFLGSSAYLSFFLNIYTCNAASTSAMALAKGGQNEPQKEFAT